MDPIDINWELAPADADAAATHIGAEQIERRGIWRKFQNDKVYYFKNGWVEIQGATPDRWKMYNIYVLRPIPVDAPLPNGLKWPDGYDYFNPAAGGGFFFNDDGYALAGIIDRYVPWAGLRGKDIWVDDPRTIKRKGGGVVKEKVVQEQPKPKVGWWN